MKPVITIVLSLLCSLPIHARRMPPPADVVIRNARVISMLPADAGRKVWPLQTVAISHGVVVFVGAAAKAPAFAGNPTRYDAHGAYLVPGLADMHCHMPEDPDEARRFCALSLAGGVTMLRVMGGGEAALGYRNDEAFAMPHLAIGMRVWGGQAMDPARADSLTAKAVSDGYDFIKTMSIHDSETFVNLATSAHRQGLPICGHYLKNVPLETVILQDYHSIEHLSGQDAVLAAAPATRDQVLAAYKAHNIYQCPTLDWFQVMTYQQQGAALRSRAGMGYAADTTLAKWDKTIADDLSASGADSIARQQQAYAAVLAGYFRMLKAFGNAGDGLIMGADAGGLYSIPGFAMQEEMKLWKRAGLTNYQILQAATRNAAAYLGGERYSGVISPGKAANMILLTKNPLLSLDALNTVQQVFVGNAVYRKDALVKGVVW